MNIFRILFPLALLGLAGLLSACAGGALATTSWPGVAIDQETAYVAFGDHIYAVDTTNGFEKWRFPTDTERNVTFFAEPEIVDGQEIITGDYERNLYLLNAESGQEITEGNWPFSQALARYIGGTLVTQAGIFAPNSDGSLYALDIQGAPTWAPFESSEALWGKPATDGSQLLLPSMDHSLYSLDPETGNINWSTPLGGALASTPSLSDDGIIYVGNLANQMVALDADNGREIWSYETLGWVWSSPVLDGDLLYFGDLNGVFYILDRNRGTEIWKNEFDDGAIVGTPLILEDAVYFGTDKGSLYSLDKETRSPRWPQPLAIEGEIYAPLETANDFIIVAPIGNDAILIAINPDGVQQWTFVPQS